MGVRAWLDLSPRPNRLLKNGVSVRDPALRGSGECSHTGPYAARPHRRAPGLTARHWFFNSLLTPGARHSGQHPRFQVVVERVIPQAQQPLQRQREEPPLPLDRHLANPTFRAGGGPRRPEPRPAARSCGSSWYPAFPGRRRCRGCSARAHNRRSRWGWRQRLCRSSYRPRVRIQ